MRVITEFDPWGDPLCTCPRKYSLNPYTGCQHHCLYCYITSYIPRAFNCRPKRDLLARIRAELPKLDRRLPVSLSNSSDPYPPMEGRLHLTRKCLQALAQAGFAVQIITKSNLVVGDLDLLEGMRAVVSFTLTTLNRQLASKLEPRAPAPAERLRAIQAVSSRGIPVTVRLDPLFPGLNEEEIEEIVGAAAGAGAVHITASTFKPRPDAWQRMMLAFPEFCQRTRELYYREGERHGRARYLPLSLRRRLLLRVREACERFGLTFSTCREGLKELNTSPSCDGTHLLSSSFARRTASLSHSNRPS
ncbi:MAG: radical SAM protein [Candidatus Hadarchaeales archaeon]